MCVRIDNCVILNCYRLLPPPADRWLCSSASEASEASEAPSDGRKYKPLLEMLSCQKIIFVTLVCHIGINMIISLIIK